MKMLNRSTTALVRQSIGWSAALAGLTLALLTGAGPASAKNMTPCQLKRSFCAERCVMNNPGKSDDEGLNKSNACISRTCDHQFKACAALNGESSNTSSAGMTPPRGVSPITGRGPRTGMGGRPGGAGSGSRPGREAGNVRDHRGGGGRIIRRVKSPSTPAGEVSLPSGGILDNMGGGFGQHGPAATGSPLSTGGSKTSSGPVIIR
jgi:hypothetical protein